MAARLVDLYTVGQAVEIKLQDGGWYAGQIVRHDHPGVWVQTADIGTWFVTNGRNIRAAASGDTARSPSDE